MLEINKKRYLEFCLTRCYP